MKKSLGSVVMILSLFFSTNAMNDQGTGVEETDCCVIEIHELTKSQLSQAIKDRNLDKVYDTIECADHDFFASLSIADTYWLLLTTFNWYIDHSSCDLIYRNTLLDTMYAIFGYTSREDFWNEHSETNERTATVTSEFVELLININLHGVIDCAVTYGLENIMHLVVKTLSKNKELAQKCICIVYQSLEPLHTAIKFCHAGIVKIILEDFIPLMLDTDEHAQHVWHFIGREFLFAACFVQLHPEHDVIVLSFLNNDLIASHLSNSDLNYAYNTIDNSEIKGLIEPLLESRKSSEALPNNSSYDYNYFYGIFSFLNWGQ